MAEHEGDGAERRVPRTAAWLGGGGLIPFAGAAVLAWIGSDAVAGWAAHAGALYGAVILSFLGGAQWGFASTPSSLALAARRACLLVLSVVPSLAAWGALFLPGAVSLAALAAAFAAVLALDLWAAKTGLAPAWWMRLRIPLSVGVIVCLLLILAAPSL